MNAFDYAITFACYNQVDYTRKCLESFVDTGIDLRRVVAVDNGSSDQTREYLSGLDLGGRIFNKANLGCGVAWNQGALALQAEWTVVMNNDVIAAPGWLENMLSVAQQRGLKVVSPAMIEGELDYDFHSFARDASTRMKDLVRLGGRHAVCLAVHQSVWLDVGYFQPVPKLFGYEDTLFFNELEKAGLPMGMTGASWLHHFGSITQKAMKQERGMSNKQGLGAKNNHRLLQQSWLERKLKKMQRLQAQKQWRNAEVAEFGQSIHGLREAQQFTWI